MKIYKPVFSDKSDNLFSLKPKNRKPKPAENYSAISEVISIC